MFGNRRSRVVVNKSLQWRLVWSVTWPPLVMVGTVLGLLFGFVARLKTALADIRAELPAYTPFLSATATFSDGSRADATGLVRWITDDGGIASLSDGLLTANATGTTTVHAQYEDLVDERMRRESGVTQDYRELRHELRWRVDRYKVAVELLHNPSDPETLERIEEALRPLLMLSAHMSRASSPELDEELDQELVASELFQARQALEEEDEEQAQLLGDADIPESESESESELEPEQTNA